MDPAEQWAGLSPREREVLKRIVLDESDPEIGRQLGVSFTTVRSHAAHLRKKLGVRTRLALALWAVRNGRCP